MAARHRSDFPTARPRELGRGHDGRRAGRSPSVRAWPRRRWPPPSTACAVDLGAAAARRGRGDHRHRRHRRRARGAAPLDRPRAGPGGPPAVARRPVRHRAGHRGRLLLRLRAARRGPLQRRRPRADRRARCGRSSPRTSRSSATSTSIDEGLELFADQPFKREIIEAVGRRGGRGRRRPAAVAHGGLDLPQLADASSTCAAGPHVPVDRPARPLRADAGGRRLLAGRREAPAAAADLRHGLGVREGAGRAPAPAGGGRAARPPQARRRARPVLASPRRSASGLAVFHPKGGTIRRLMEDYSRQRHVDGGLRVRQHAPHHQGRAVRDLGPPRLVRRGHVPADGARRRAAVLPQADELPVPHPHLQEPPALLPRAAAAALRVRHRLPLREVGRAARA